MITKTLDDKLHGEVVSVDIATEKILDSLCES